LAAGEDALGGEVSHKENIDRILPGRVGWRRTWFGRIGPGCGGKGKELEERVKGGGCGAGGFWLKGGPVESTEGTFCLLGEGVTEAMGLICIGLCGEKKSTKRLEAESQPTRLLGKKRFILHGSMAARGNPKQGSVTRESHCQHNEGKKPDLTLSSNRKKQKGRKPSKTLKKVPTPPGFETPKRIPATTHTSQYTRARNRRGRRERTTKGKKSARGSKTIARPKKESPHQFEVPHAHLRKRTTEGREDLARERVAW